MKRIGAILKKSCPLCKSDMILRDSKFGLFYGCVNYPDCKSTHGAHKNPRMDNYGEPFGIPADEETKKKRMEAHDLFDRLWKKKLYTRKKSYELLQEMMNLSAEEAHISRFNIEQCEKLIGLLQFTKEL